MNIFIDCETTGKNPYNDEVITMFLQKEDGTSLMMESQVDNWNDAAASIHGISYPKMLTFQSKNDAWDSVVSFIRPLKKINLICYANYQTELGYLLFDVVLFKIGLMNHLGLERENHLPCEITGESVHSLARESHRNGLYEALKNPSTGRYSYKQEAVYAALFNNETYTSHSAFDDVKAMIRIYNHLNNLIKSKTIQSGQTSLPL